MSDTETATQHLIEVLAQENAALKRLDFPAATALLPAKEAALAELGTPPAAQIQPPELARHLIDLAAENQILLERAIFVQTRIVRIIARAGALPAAETHYNGHRGRPPIPRATALALSTRA